MVRIREEHNDYRMFDLIEPTYKYKWRCLVCGKWTEKKPTRQWGVYCQYCGTKLNITSHLGTITEEGKEEEKDNEIRPREPRKWLG